MHPRPRMEQGCITCYLLLKNIQASSRPRMSKDVRLNTLYLILEIQISSPLSVALEESVMRRRTYSPG